MTGSEDLGSFLDRELRIVELFQAGLAEQGLPTTALEGHVRNAKIFVKYLSVHAGAPLAALHEYDLRVFLLDWYPSKVAATPEEAAAVPDSLRRFLGFLAEKAEIRLPGARDALEEEELFLSRCATFPGEERWSDEVEAWQAAGRAALDSRVMVHDRGLGIGEWDAKMGLVEARLERELQRRWLLWRDELLDQGITDPKELRRLLVSRQRAWEMAAHPDLNERTPIQAIGAERAGARPRQP